jgi:membrane-associated phospholipid phosphatase
MAMVVGFTAAPAGAGEGVGPIAASIERAVDAALESERPSTAEPVVCEAGCSRLQERTPEDKKPHLHGKAAMGVGLVAGGLAGFGLGESGETSGPPTPLRGWGTGDWVLAATVGTAWASTRLFDRQPESLAGGRWSDCSNGQDRLNAFDLRIAKALGGKRWRQQAVGISDATLSASAALPFGLALGANPDERGHDVRVALGALAVNLALTDVVKRVADRPRPYAHFCRPSRPEDLAKDDAHYSFYSGHSSTAFAMAVTAGMLSHYHGYRNEAGVWATGLTLATTTAVLRIAADRHYATDGIAGAAAGAFIGWLVPRLHRPAEMPPIRTRTTVPPAATIALPLRFGGSSGEGTLRAGFGTGPLVEATWRW